MESLKDILLNNFRNYLIANNFKVAAIMKIDINLPNFKIYFKTSEGFNIVERGFLLQPAYLANTKRIKELAFNFFNNLIHKYNDSTIKIVHNKWTYDPTLTFIGMIYYLSIEDIKREVYFNNLPNEMITNIAEYLDEYHLLYLFKVMNINKARKDSICHDLLIKKTNKNVYSVIKNMTVGNIWTEIYVCCLPCIKLLENINNIFPFYQYKRLGFGNMNTKLYDERIYVLNLLYFYLISRDYPEICSISNIAEHYFSNSLNDGIFSENYYKINKDVKVSKYYNLLLSLINNEMYFIYDIINLIPNISDKHVSDLLDHAISKKFNYHTFTKHIFKEKYKFNRSKILMWMHNRGNKLSITQILMEENIEFIKWLLGYNNSDLININLPFEFNKNIKGLESITTRLYEKKICNSIFINKLIELFSSEYSDFKLKPFPEITMML